MGGRAISRLFILFTLLSLGLLANESGLLPATLPVHAQGTATAHVFVDPGNITDLSPSRSSVTFGVNVSGSPPISTFLVSVQYDTHMFHQQPTVDYNGNILQNTTNAAFLCIDGGGACASSGIDGPGVVTLGLFLFGNQTSTQSNGLLFRMKFNIIGKGLGQLHLLYVLLSNKGEQIPFTASDGFFANGYCGSIVCRPPSVVQLTLSPSVFSAGRNGTFIATVRLGDPNDAVLNYTWIFRDSVVGSQGYLVTTTGTAQHAYSITGNYTVSLGFIDNYQITWWTSLIVSVTTLIIKLSVGEIVVTPQVNVLPGTLVHIHTVIYNRSTIPEKANFSITVEQQTPALNSTTVSLPDQGQAGLDANWPTAGLVPRAYRIVVVISPIPGENDTSGNIASAYVLLISSEPTGLLSLSLLETTGLGALVLVGLVVGLGRFLKKPSYETEPI